MLRHYTATIAQARFALHLFVIAAVAVGSQITSLSAQQPATYKQVETIVRYQRQSTEAQLLYAAGEPYFQPLSDADKKRIESANRTAETAISEDKKAVLKNLESVTGPIDELAKRFFAGHVFAEMTQTSHDKISRLGTMRNDFLNNYLSRKVTGTTRQKFIDDVVMPAMTSIHANAEFHPAVRLNAVYVIGMIDSQAPNRTGDQMTIPSTKAFEELKQLFIADNTPAYLKVGALAGLERHVKIDRIVGNQIPANEKQKLNAELSAVLAGSAAGQQTWPAEIDYWLKRRSVQILGLMGSANSLDPMLTILKSPNAGVWLQFDAMQTIGLLDLKNAPQPKIKEAALVITQFLATNLESESKSIRQSLDELVYSNMLFADTDLELTGTPWGDDKAIMPGAGMIGGGGGFDDFGLGGGMDFPDPRRGGGRRIPGAEEEVRQIVDLPTYELNSIRSRVKALAFTGRMVLKSGNFGLHRLADAETGTFIDGVASELSRLLERSNIGITNLDIPPVAPTRIVEKQSIAEKLATICSASAEQLDRALGNQGGQEAIDPLENESGIPEFDPAASVVPSAPAAIPARTPVTAAPVDGPDFGG